jgi:uncharacterized protein with HEPN domain
VDHQGETFDLKVVEEQFQVSNMAVQAILGVLRFVGETTTQMIESNNPVILTKFGDQPAVIIGPGRVAMNHDYRRAIALVEVVESAVVEREIFRGKRIFREEQ